jgi:isopenicillin N synthase-like dioxygenase
VSVPVVDLEAPGAILLLEQACRGAGVFYLRATRDVVASEDRLLSLSRDFFGLPMQERMKVALPPGGATGYVPPDNLRHDVLFCVFTPREVSLPAGVHVEPNRWPDALPGLATATEEYLRALFPLGRMLVAALAAACHSPAHALLGLYGDEPGGGVALRRYLARREGEDPAVLPAHCDPLPFTFISQRGGAGLEAQLESGEWIATPHEPGAVLCQLGEASARWSDDRFRPCTHRVHHEAAADRLSLVMSMAPKLDAVIECLPGVRPQGSPPRYPPIRTLDLLTRLSDRMKV